MRGLFGVSALSVWAYIGLRDLWGWSQTQTILAMLCMVPLTYAAAYWCVRKETRSDWFGSGVRDSLLIVVSLLAVPTTASIPADNALARYAASWWLTFPLCCVFAVALSWAGAFIRILSDAAGLEHAGAVVDWIESRIPEIKTPLIRPRRVKASDYEEDNFTLAGESVPIEEWSTKIDKKRFH